MKKHYEEMSVEELLVHAPTKPTEEMNLSEIADATAYWRARYFTRLAQYKAEDEARARAEREVDNLVRIGFTN